MRGLVTLFVVFVIVFCSCKKNYTCTCSTTTINKTNSGGGTTTATNTVTSTSTLNIISQTTIDDTKSSADKKCSAMSNTSANPPINCSVN